MESISRDEQPGVTKKLIYSSFFFFFTFLGLVVSFISQFIYYSSLFCCRYVHRFVYTLKCLYVYNFSLSDNFFDLGKISVAIFFAGSFLCRFVCNVIMEFDA